MDIQCTLYYQNWKERKIPKSKWKKVNRKYMIKEIIKTIKSDYFKEKQKVLDFLFQNESE